MIHVWIPAGSFLPSEEPIDFVIILGGDGTVLHVSSLFQTVVPPVLTFNLGSLGFLAVDDFSDHKKVIQHVVDGQARINLRMRLNCRHVAADTRLPSTGSSSDGTSFIPL